MKKVFLLTIGFLIASLIGGCSKEAPREEAHEHEESSNIVKLSLESMREIGLEVQAVVRKPFSRRLIAPAKVVANQDQEAQVGSLLPGRVQKVFVNIGDYVKTGQPLMQVEGLEIGEIQAGFLKAKANLDYVETAFNRQKSLLEQNVGSQKAFLEAQAEYAKALAEYRAEDKRIHSVGLLHEEISIDQLGEAENHSAGMLTIKSPIDGIIVERNVVIGQFVDAQTNAFRIINLSTVWIDGQIHENNLPKLQVNTGTIFTSSANPEEQFTGRVIYVGQVIDERTRTITIRARFTNSSGKLKPQMFGELVIPISPSASALIIPAEAIVKESNHDYVFVQTSDSTFEKRDVLTGTEQDGEIEIKEGLNEGEIVASNGVFYLKSELKKEELSGDEH